MLEIHSSLRDFVYESMTAEERTRWHSVAADHYLSKADLQERLRHLIRANRGLEAEMLLARRSDELLSKGNAMRVWSIISSFEAKKPKYADQVTLAKARAASTVGELDRAWALLESVARADGPMRAESLVEMGRIMSKRGETHEASRLFSEALEAAAGRPGVRAMALRGLGVVENKLGRYPEAQELLEASAKEAMSAMDQKGMLLAHLELGNVLIGRGKYSEAIDHFSKCAAGFGPVELTNVYVNMGIACAHLGRTGDARQHLENAVKLADDTGQPRAKAYALTSLAEVLTRTGDPEHAKEHCFGALEVFSEIGDRLGLSAAYANLGMAERLTGDLRSSEEHYMESLEALDGMDVPWSLGVRKLEFAQLMAEKGDARGARKLFGEAKTLFEGIGADDMIEKVRAATSSLR
jgi:tetratricopeptide (TPR) repeat protein